VDDVLATHQKVPRMDAKKKKKKKKDALAPAHVIL